MSAMRARKRELLMKTLRDYFPDLESRVKQLKSGDKVIFKKGDEQLLVCCQCGASHIIYFDKNCTMTIWDPGVFVAPKKKR